MELMFTEQCMYVTFDSEHIYLFVYLFGFGRRVYVINDFNNLYSHLSTKMWEINIVTNFRLQKMFWC